MDELRDEFLDKYHSCPKTAVWNRQKAEFLTKMATLTQNTTALIRIDIPIEESEELGILDYRAAFDSSIDLFCRVTNELTAEANRLNDKTTTRAKQLSSLNPKSPNISQARGIMISTANDMKQMSDAIDVNAPKLLECFKTSIENAFNLQQCGNTDQTTKEENREALNNLILSIISAKDATIQCMDSLSDIPNMEKSQIAAKNRLVKGYSTLISVYDECITKATELLKA